MTIPSRRHFRSSGVSVRRVTATSRFVTEMIEVFWGGEAPRAGNYAFSLLSQASP